MLINTASTNIPNKEPHSHLNSTSYNNATTFINKAEIATTQKTTAVSSNISLGAPANNTFRASFSSIAHNTVTSPIRK